MKKYPPFVQISTCDASDPDRVRLYALDSKGDVWYYSRSYGRWDMMPRRTRKS